MKNSYIFYLLILLIVLSCQNNDEIYNQSVVGMWFQDSGEIDGSDMSYRNEIIFKLDGTYERSLQVVETNDIQNIIGYQSLIIGEYQINNNTLKRLNIEQYGLDNMNIYLDRADLVFEHSKYELPEISLTLAKQGDILILGYTCPDNTLCISHQTFYRSN